MRFSKFVIVSCIILLSFSTYGFSQSLEGGAVLLPKVTENGAVDIVTLSKDARVHLMTASERGATTFRSLPKDDGVLHPTAPIGGIFPIKIPFPQTPPSQSE